ncbi:LOW QUALITY PROTEIN: UDP-N-acetylmuramoylalanine-D-glutamate ligase [Bacillus sp. JCM 19046]|nr:LOW QUALITY PROTEIN: UDP-N-acetylmuramoylalanine-D-glutamate ligase [Bacillus sp. JCM 19046]
MKQLTEFHQKKILILGLAKSGVAAATMMHRLGASVTVNDSKERSEMMKRASLKRLGIQVVAGGHPLYLLEEIDLLIKNPGIPYQNVLVKEATSRGIPVWTEVELAYRISEAEMIAITGSNGKTTTTTLIVEMLENSKRKPLVAGNIGTVATDVAKVATANDVIVVELSSFQLMGTEAFRPKIAVWLNIFDAHLDYHGTRDDYVAAKAKIMQNLSKDETLVYNADDVTVAEAAKHTDAKLVSFSTKEKVTNGAYLDQGKIYFQEEVIIELNEVVLPGLHNVENMLAAVAAVKLAGGTNKQIQHVLKTFKGVKHRLQFVGEWQNRLIYNDSKATNILATKAALSAFTKPIVLIAGGLDRGNEFDELLPDFSHVEVLVAFGQTREKLVSLGEKAGVTIIEADNVEDATKKALAGSTEGQVILLSPACASWDQYRSFEVRGDAFLETVQRATKIK